MLSAHVFPIHPFSSRAQPSYQPKTLWLIYNSLTLVGIMHESPCCVCDTIYAMNWHQLIQTRHNFNVFTASNSIHVELHHVQCNFHIITITQHYNIAQRVVCTISQPSKLSAKLHKGDHCLTLRICIFDSIRLYFSHSYYGPALSLHICICIFDCVFSLTLPTLLQSS